MPRTSFTCRDKILGGYYADAETNCQMFHICVKVAGIGIQDFRFLCPNGTAFDQEAQICADWGDVDCEAATLYYGSNNFDLYRIGSNFENKRINNNFEEEDVFHLQRAESNDARRSKQYIVNQNAIQSPVRSTTTTLQPTTTTTQRTTTFSTTRAAPSTTTTSAPPRSYFESSTRIVVSTYKPTLQPKKLIEDKTAVSTYRPKNNDYFNRAKISSNDDEILKQSQSSHFYNNKNNGKEDFEDDFVRATKAPAKQKVRGRQRGRSKFRNTNNNNNINAVTSAPARNTFATTTTSTVQNTRTSFTNTPIVVQPINNQRQNVTQLQASNSYQSQPTRQTSTNGPILARTTDETFFDVPKIKQKVITTKLKSASAAQQSLNVVPLIQSSTFAPPPSLPPQIPQFNFDPFQQNVFGAIPQRVIIPSQLNKEQRLALQASNGNLGGFQTTVTTTTTQQVPSSTTPVTPQQINTNRANQVSNEQKSLPQKFNFKTQKYEFIEPQNPTTQFYNTKYETKGTDQLLNGNVNLETTKSGFVKQNNKTYASRQTTTSIDENNNKPTTFNPQQYYQSDQYQNLSPRGFSLAAQQQQQKKTPAPEIRPQITSRSETRHHHKKFSTLVPKENYNPTTFKPNTYSKKPVDTKIEKIQNPNNYYSQLITSVPTYATSTTTQSASIFNQFPTTTRISNFFSTSSTPRPLGENEEDDGQYRPELYEKDLYKNRIKTTKATSAPLLSSSSTLPVKNTLYQFYQTSTTPRVQNNNYNNADEDEFLKTEHSQNIFASGNKLRAEKEKEKNQFGKGFEQYSETSSPRPFSKPTPQSSTTVKSQKTAKVTKPTKKVIQKAEEKDVSYDYQYYDTNGDQDYTEIDAAIEDFGRTVKKSSTN
ncbi:hypothetical protein PVAND_001708 [Polypedilum vanderplanki]|uniref:Chitin-binding type-2 domain-containing protein n=1 Tax=Polypedilum vanderplanki TaxID=319348 RepID=A0A9J6BP11_POLVA|nr:hypothetical protein PVAND_001708 [Polypedilum vanderplanki]